MVFQQSHQSRASKRQEPIISSVALNSQNDPVQQPDRSHRSAANGNFEQPSRFDYSFATVPNDSSGQTIIQPKLVTGRSGDRYEQEADDIAGQVVQQLQTPQLGRAAKVQPHRFASHSLQNAETIAATPNLEASIHNAQGQGRSLANDIRKPMEHAFDTDLSQVRVHTHGTADQLNRAIESDAFTTGNHIFFRQGTFHPHSRSGQELLAHELTHVVQQGAIPSNPRSASTVLQARKPARTGGVTAKEKDDLEAAAGRGNGAQFSLLAQALYLKDSAYYVNLLVYKLGKHQTSNPAKFNIWLNYSPPAAKNAPAVSPFLPVVLPPMSSSTGSVPKPVSSAPPPLVVPSMPSSMGSVPKPVSSAPPPLVVPSMPSSTGSVPKPVSSAPPPLVVPSMPSSMGSVPKPVSSAPPPLIVPSMPSSMGSVPKPVVPPHVSSAIPPLSTVPVSGSVPPVSVAPAPPVLPTGWTETKPVSGKPYYYNVDMKRSYWEKPVAGQTKADHDRVVQENLNDRAKLQSVILKGKTGSNRRLKNSIAWIEQGKAQLFAVTDTADSVDRATKKGKPGGRAYFPDPLSSPGEDAFSSTPSGYDWADLTSTSNVFVEENAHGMQKEKTISIANASAKADNLIEETLRHEVQHAADRHEEELTALLSEVSRINPAKDSPEEAKLRADWAFITFKTEYRAFSYEESVPDTSDPQISKVKTQLNMVATTPWTDEQAAIALSILNNYSVVKDAFLADLTMSNGKNLIIEIAKINDPDKIAVNKYNSPAIDDCLNALTAISASSPVSDATDLRVQALLVEISKLSKEDAGYIVDKSEGGAFRSEVNTRLVKASDAHKQVIQAIKDKA